MEDKFNRKVANDQLASRLPTDSPTEPAINSGDEMSVDSASEEVKKSNQPRSVSRKSSDMRASDNHKQKLVNTEKTETGPSTRESGNNRDKFKESEGSPEPPFEHLTRGDHHTSSGKFWAFTGVQFPGSRATLSTLIPTLRLPISEENIARQISDKANYVQEKHNIKSMFILKLESSITTSGQYTNSDNKHSPLRVFRDLADHPPVYFQAAPGSAKEFATQKEIAIIRGFSSSPGIIESTIAALQLTLSIRAPRAKIVAIVAPLKTYFKPRNKPSPRHTTDKRWHGTCRERNALKRPHTEDVIRLFVPTNTPDSALKAVIAYLFPRNSQQAEIRGPGYRLQTVVNLTHLVTRCQSICDSVLRDLPYVTQIINCRRGITHTQALHTLRAGGIDPADIDLLGIARSNKSPTTQTGDTVVVVWKRIWYPGESTLVLCPPITQQLLANFRANGLHKPRQYSHYLPLDDTTTRQNDCDTVSNYPRQAELGLEGNICGSIIFEYKASPRGRLSPVRTSSSRPTAFAGYWLTIAHESSRTNRAGRPQRQYLVLPDDTRRLPDRDMRPVCRRHKAATSDMHITDDLTTVRTNLDAATAAQSYYQAQISQLSYDVAQLREQLKSITDQQSSVSAAQHMTTPPLNPTATAYCPQSPTSLLGDPAPLPEQKQDPSRPLTGAVHVSPAPGTPAASPTPSPQPALPRARNTTGGFAAAFKSAVSKSKARSSPATCITSNQRLTRPCWHITPTVGSHDRTQPLTKWLLSR